MGGGLKDEPCEMYIYTLVQGLSYIYISHLRSKGHETFFTVKVFENRRSFHLLSPMLIALLILDMKTFSRVNVRLWVSASST